MKRISISFSAVLLLISSVCLAAFTFNPAPHSHNAALNTTLVADLGGTVDPTTVTSSTFVVHSSLHWPASGSFSVAGSVITFTPSAPFRLGETVEVTLTSGIKVNGVNITPAIWKFTVTSGTAGTGTFYDSNQDLGTDRNNQTGLGDFRNLGRLDAIEANWVTGPAYLWTNDGTGIFTRGQPLSAESNEGVVVADLKNDGTPAAAFCTRGGGPSTIWFSDGSGTFSDSGQSLAAGNALGIAGGDLNGDGYIDLLFAVNGANVVFLNDGDGTFTQTPQNLGSAIHLFASIGDLDNDGDLDVWVVSNGGSSIYLNDGSGTLTLNQSPLSGNSYVVALGDLNEDGWLDAFVVCGNPATTQKIYLNDGTGTFVLHQSIGNWYAQGVGLADFNRDGHLDAFVSVRDTGNVLLINDGSGTFTDSGQIIGAAKAQDVALGDLNGDGTLDAFVSGALVTPTKIWFQFSTSVPPTLGLLRNDEISSLDPLVPLIASIFTGRAPLSLDLNGPDGIPNEGEGALQSTNGSSDDDDLYVAAFFSGGIDPDPVSVIGDRSRPLIFYEKTIAGNSLRLYKGNNDTLIIFY